MKLIAVNVGMPRTVVWKGKSVTTGIYKQSVHGRIALRTLNLDGDRQADPTVHGGPSKAIYAYPAEHYDFWRRELPGTELPWGSFGENFTTEGLHEDAVCIGDRFGIGTAAVVVTEPRLPCYKLAGRFRRQDLIKRFLASGRTGFYFAVAREGEVGAGDRIQRLARDPHGVTVADITRLYARDKKNLALLRRAVEAEALPESWRVYFAERIAKLERGGGAGARAADERAAADDEAAADENSADD